MPFSKIKAKCLRRVYFASDRYLVEVLARLSYRRVVPGGGRGWFYVIATYQLADRNTAGAKRQAALHQKATPS